MTSEMVFPLKPIMIISKRWELYEWLAWFMWIFLVSLHYMKFWHQMCCPRKIIYTLPTERFSFAPPHHSGNSKFPLPTNQYWLPFSFRTSDVNDNNSGYFFCDATCNLTSLLFCHLFRRTLVWDQTLLGLMKQSMLQPSLEADLPKMKLVFQSECRLFVY